MILYRLWRKDKDVWLRKEKGVGEYRHELNDPNNKKENEFFHQDKAPKCSPTFYYTRDSAERARRGVYEGDHYEIIPYEVKETNIVEASVVLRPYVSKGDSL